MLCVYIALIVFQNIFRPISLNAYLCGYIEVCVGLFEVVLCLTFGKVQRSRLQRHILPAQVGQLRHQQLVLGAATRKFLPFGIE